MLTRRKCLLIGVQSAAGVAATLSASTHAVLVTALDCKPVDVRMTERNIIKPTLAPEQKTHGGNLWELTFTVDLKGSGVAGVPPEFGPALRACGLHEEVVPATSVTYRPSSEDHELVTAEFYLDGKRIRLRDCRGTLTADINSAQSGKVSFTLKGHEDAITDTAIPSAGYQSTVPPVARGLTGLMIAGHQSEISQLTLDLGNQVSAGGSIRSESGYGEVRISARAVTGQVDPEDTALAVKNWVAEWQSGAVAAITTGVVGKVAGNRWAVTLPRTYWTDMQPGDREGTATQQASFAALETDGDDELELVFT